MQHGFSMVGVAFLLMLFVPNIKWGRNQPPGYAEMAKHGNRILLTLERVGQVAATCAAVVFVCPQGFSFPGVLRLCAALLLMVLYETPGPAISKAEKSSPACTSRSGPFRCR